MRTLLVLTALALVTACGAAESDRGNRDRDSARSEKGRDSERGDRNDKERGRDSAREEEMTADERQLSQELGEAVRELRRELPSRDGPITLTDVELDGLELVYDGRLDASFTQDQVDEFRREFRRNLCAEPDTRDTVRRGASITYNLEDNDGREFSTSLARCD